MVSNALKALLEVLLEMGVPEPIAYGVMYTLAAIPLIWLVWLFGYFLIALGKLLLSYVGRIFGIKRLEELREEITEEEKRELEREHEEWKRRNKEERIGCKDLLKGILFACVLVVPLTVLLSFCSG